jgi:hypothetical protein
VKVLVCGRGKGKRYFLGKVDNDKEEESLRAAFDRLAETMDNLTFDIKEVSNGTYESLEKGDMFADDL